MVPKLLSSCSIIQQQLTLQVNHYSVRSWELWGREPRKRKLSKLIVNTGHCYTFNLLILESLYLISSLLPAQWPLNSQEEKTCERVKTKTEKRSLSCLKKAKKLYLCRYYHPTLCNSISIKWNNYLISPLPFKLYLELEVEVYASS